MKIRNCEYECQTYSLFFIFVIVFKPKIYVMLELLLLKAVGIKACSSIMTFMY